MKSTFIKLIIIIAAGTFGFMSCDILGGGSSSSSTKPIGGDPTPIGEVGNTFRVPSIPGTTNSSIKVIDNNGADSNIEFSGTVTNPVLLQLANHMEEFSVDGNQVTGARKFRITDKGIQTYTSGGKLNEGGKPFTLIEYDAKKGDRYVLKRRGGDLVRRVVERSTDNDFYWGGMFIRTIQVEETGIQTPGVSRIKYHFNHRFGMVAMDVYFEDGSEMLMWVMSSNDN